MRNLVFFKKPKTFPDHCAIERHRERNTKKEYYNELGYKQLGSGYTILMWQSWIKGKSKSDDLYWKQCLGKSKS